MFDEEGILQSHGKRPKLTMRIKKEIVPSDIISQQTEIRTDDNQALNTSRLTKTKTFRCDLCEKEFARETNFKMHQRVHTNERRYKCDVCTMTFQTHSNMKTHQKIHYNVRKSYYCQTCGKGTIMQDV